jgi:hypothetical protein
MIADFEKYHGVALRSIVVANKGSVLIRKCEETGRVNSYVINEKVAILIKHSSKRLPPWQFTFTEDQLDELRDLQVEAEALWLVLVCGSDGIVALAEYEFEEIVGPLGFSTPFVRIDRGRRTMYHVHGNAGRLGAAKANGVAEIVRSASVLMSGAAHA